jgi:hypothetical protein
MAKFMKENGRKTIVMEKENKRAKKKISTRENSKTTRKRDWEK